MSEATSRPRPAFLASLGAGAKPALRPTETKEKAVDLGSLLAAEPTSEKEAKTREYFFSAGIDAWLEKAAEHTFKTAAVPIKEAEAKAIIKNWKDVTSKQSQLEDEGTVEVPAEVKGLVEKIDAAIKDNFPPEVAAKGFFVKLSTRSPKDSKTVFRKAVRAFKINLEAAGGHLSKGEGKDTEDNARLIGFSEEMVKACVVRSGLEAVTILLDSWRVAEDLEYSLEGEKPAPVSVIIRAFDDRILPHCEFRGFVWEGKLTCIGQYWHSLYYPKLEAHREEITRDCQALFEKIKPALPVPTAMLDIAWLGPGKETILIEVNPLCDGLGSFKGSTGLFDYTEAVLRGEAPFELRLRDEPEARADLQKHMSQEWRRVIFGY